MNIHIPTLKISTDSHLTSTTLLIGAAIGISALAPVISVASNISAADIDSYAISEKGLNYRVWTKVSPHSTSERPGHSHNDSYTELGTGLAHLVDGQLRPSSDKIRISETGAEANDALHGVRFLGNINTSGAIDVTMPDGQHLASSPLAISYFERSSGRSVVLGEIKDSFGELLPSGRQAVYRNAFTNIRADVLYEMSVAGLEQFVILRESLPSPADWGLDPASTMLQVITEFVNAPNPVLTELEGETGSDLRIDFGSMQMVKGSAFSLGSGANRVPVTKEWGTADGRTFLIEQVPFTLASAALRHLKPAASPSVPREKRSAMGREMPASRQIAKNSPPFINADTDSKEMGFAMDYTLLNSQSNLVLQSDTTYFVSSVVNVSGTLTIEGGTVVKYTNSVGSVPATISCSNVICKTGPYRVAVFTAKDDDSIGQKITGSTGTPSGLYGLTALDCSSASSVPVLSNLRFHYLSNALAGASLTIQDSQFVQCENALTAGSTKPTLNNVLVYNLNSVLPNLGSSNTLTAVNTTVHYCTNFFNNTNGTVNLTNCLFADVTNWNCTITHTNFNAFLTSDVGVFQTVGTGAHYLNTNSVYRNAGTTNIASGLWADLKKRTTYPPVVYLPQVVSTSVAFTTQAQRDTDAIDLGFHYAPLDYALSGYFLTNCTLSVTQANVAVAAFGTNIYTYGIGLGGNAKVSVQGKANGMVELTAFNTVQEQANSNWQSPSYALITDAFPGSNLGINIHFADFSVLAQDVPHFDLQSNSTNTLQDAQLHGGSATTGAPTVNLTNCLFERVNVDFEPNDNKQSCFRNNLFCAGSFYFWPTLTNSVVEDNLFDKTTIQNISGLSYLGGFNAYVTNYDRLTPSFGSDIILSASPSYQTGPLGSYYLLSSNILINVDSTTTANQVGLYHYTVMTNLVGSYEIKETNSQVDVSFHYVATDANGNPIDTDGDGTPDYIEDSNGDGLFDAGDLSNWLVDNWLAPPYVRSRMIALRRPVLHMESSKALYLASPRNLRGRG
jgi:hypothetical protein